MANKQENKTEPRKSVESFVLRLFLSPLLGNSRGTRGGGGILQKANRQQQLKRNLMYKDGTDNYKGSAAARRKEHKRQTIRPILDAKIKHVSLPQEKRGGHTQFRHRWGIYSFWLEIPRPPRFSSKQQCSYPHCLQAGGWLAEFANAALSLTHATAVAPGSRVARPRFLHPLLASLLTASGPSNPAVKQRGRCPELPIVPCPTTAPAAAPSPHQVPSPRQHPSLTFSQTELGLAGEAAA